MFLVRYSHSYLQNRKWTFLHLNRLIEEYFSEYSILSLQNQKRHLLGMLFL